MTSYHSVGTKHSLVNECFGYLWYKRLGHISKERMQKLVKNEILLIVVVSLSNYDDPSVDLSNARKVIV